MKRFVKSYCVTLFCLLSAFILLNVLVDPLFQYHTPWFGMKPVITDERYQNAGIAKHFEYDNALIGNSLSENYTITDLNMALGGETAKLTFSGSHPLDWTYVLDILENRDNAPRKILFNLDPYIFRGSVTELKHELPVFLYDRNLFNDVNYVLNMDIVLKYTLNTIKSNAKSAIPDYNNIFSYADREFGKDFIRKNVERSVVSDQKANVDEYVALALDNLRLLAPYIQEMSNTEFVFFCSPFSMLFWDKSMRENTYSSYKRVYYSVLEFLLSFDNVTVYLWADNEMLNIMGNLDYYRDEAHYDGRVCHLMAERIGAGYGQVDKENYNEVLDTLFDYLEEFDYDSLWVD